MNKFLDARLAAGLTQQELSDQIGIPKRTWENYEQGSRKPAPWVERLLLEKLEGMANDMLKNKIDKAIEGEIMKHNVMGSETATVTIALTDKEKEEFLNSLWRKYDNTNHTWDMDGNELTVSWCEDGFWAEKYDVYSWEEEIKCFDDIKTGCACFAEDSNPVLLGSFGTLKEAQEFLSENETEISKVGHLWMVKEFWIDKDQRDQLGDPADTVERCVAITDTDGAVKDFE